MRGTFEDPLVNIFNSERKCRSSTIVHDFATTVLVLAQKLLQNLVVQTH